jgi:hypothetical protein
VRVIGSKKKRPPRKAAATKVRNKGSAPPTSDRKSTLNQVLRGAVAGALEDAEVDAPGADGGAVLIGHHARELMQVGQVMCGPGGEKLGKSDGAEGRVAAAEVEVYLLEVEGAEFREVFCTEAGEFVEDLGESVGFAFAEVSFAVKGSEGLRFTGVQDHADARHPVRAFAMDKMGDYIERAPSAGALVLESPRVGEIAKERVESGGSVG